MDFNRLLYILIFVLFALTTNEQCVFEALDQPNVILIIADDMGYYDPTFTGGNINTPNLNNLANQGVLFEKFLVQPSCSPSRVSLMTGINSARCGVTRAMNCYYTPNILGGKILTKTIAQIANKFEYNTATIGKQHYGEHPTDHPNLLGWDYFYGSIYGAFDYINKIDNCGRYQLEKNGIKVLNDTRYYTRLVGQETINYLNNVDSSPFFISVNFFAVHTPIMIETDSSLLKPNVNGQSFTSPYEPKVSRYQTMLKVMDEEIGNIMKTAPNNTYFIFMSDNGGLERSLLSRQ